MSGEISRITFNTDVQKGSNASGASQGEEEITINLNGETDSASDSLNLKNGKKQSRLLEQEEQTYVLSLLKETKGKKLTALKNKEGGVFFLDKKSKTYYSVSEEYGTVMLNTTNSKGKNFSKPVKIKLESIPGRSDAQDADAQPQKEIKADAKEDASKTALVKNSEKAAETDDSAAPKTAEQKKKSSKLEFLPQDAQEFVFGQISETKGKNLTALKNKSGKAYFFDKKSNTYYSIAQKDGNVYLNITDAKGRNSSKQLNISLETIAAKTDKKEPEQLDAAGNPEIKIVSDDAAHVSQNGQNVQRQTDNLETLPRENFTSLSRITNGELYGITDEMQLSSEFAKTMTGEDKKICEDTLNWVLNCAENGVRENIEKNGAAFILDGLKNITGMQSGSKAVFNKINELRSKLEDVKKGKLPLENLYKEITGNTLNKTELENLKNNKITLSNASILKYAAGL